MNIDLDLGLEQYALMEVSYTLVRLLRSFSGIKSQDQQPFIEQIGISLSNANGARVSFVPA